MVYTFKDYMLAAAPSVQPGCALWDAIREAVLPYACQKPKDDVALAAGQLFAIDCCLCAAFHFPNGKEMDPWQVRVQASRLSTMAAYERNDHGRTEASIRAVQAFLRK